MGIDLQPYLEPSAEDRAARRANPRRARRGGPLWLGAGRMVYYKGFINAIRALSHVEGRLLLIGDGPDWPAPARRGEAAGRRATASTSSGGCPYLDIIPYYLAADAFWFPSNARSEAFGLVQVEAMASGCPVINTQIPHSGVPWVSPHDETGLTVAVNDPEALADAARRAADRAWPARPPDAAARRRAVDEFDHRVMAERSLAIYRRVLAGADLADEASRPVLLPSGL